MLSIRLFKKILIIICMNSFERISAFSDIPSSPSSRANKPKITFKCIVITVYMLSVLCILIPLFGLTISLFIVEINFINNVTPFVNTLKAPDFNMTLIVPTLNRIGNIVANVCNNPEFKQLCD